MNRSKRNFHHCVNSQWFLIGRNKKLNNKRHLSADGVSLLPSALRPRLLGVAIFLQIIAASTIFALPCSTPVSAASITITVPSAPISLDINPSPSGTFLKSDATQISVKTNAFAGYTLSIRAKDDANGNNLISGTNKLASITEEEGLSEDAYKADGHNNTWAYQPSKLNSDENTNFLPGPTASPSTIEQTSAANESSDNNYNLIIAAKVDSTLAAGTYNNTFVFEATANSVPYSIQYELNSGLNGPEPNPQTGNSTESTVNLSPTVPTKDNYEFLGWCDAPTSDENCNGNTYKESSPFPLKNGDNTVTLYAIWKSQCEGYCIRYVLNGGTPLIPEQKGIDVDKDIITLDSTLPTRENYGFIGWCTTSTDIWPCSGDAYFPGSNYSLSQGSNITLYGMWAEVSGEMQNYNCSTLSENSVVALKDSRDNNIYTAAKLKDNKCWMTDALKYANGAVGVDNKWAAYYTKSTYSSKCPTGWRVPTSNEAQNIVSMYGENKNGEMVRPPLNFRLAGGWLNSSVWSQPGNDVWYWLSDTSSTDNLLYLNKKNATAKGTSGRNLSNNYAFPILCIKG